MSFFLAAFVISSAVAAPTHQLVSVFSRTANGYTRTLQSDNSFKTETYAFAPGGRLDGFGPDESVDNLTFAQVAGVVASALKGQNYVGTTDAKTAQLLIVLSWGTTSGMDETRYRSSLTNIAEAAREMGNVPDLGAAGNGVEGIDFQRALRNAAGESMDSSLSLVAMQNGERDRTNQVNADILGYTGELRDAMLRRSLSPTAQDVISEVEESRYFVVLKAYDFQLLRNNKQKRLLWETRYSIRRHGNRFDEELLSMSRFASQFYGRDLGRLVRRPLREGRVEVGTPHVIETGK